MKTNLLCSIQKGIVKRQLPFSRVKSCHDGAGSRFSISFKDHHDYELEATSPEDKHKVSARACVCVFNQNTLLLQSRCFVPLFSLGCFCCEQIMQLVGQIIYGNIYSAETVSQPEASLREGVLLLHRGGLASFRWVKYGWKADGL